MNDAPMRLAIPSKGRLFQPIIDFLNACGFAIRRGESDRAYTLKVTGLKGVVIDLVAASEIPALLAEGKCHLGITGLDLVSEFLGHQPPSIADAGPASPDLPHLLAGLGLGHADLEVAVPRAWIDVETMADLADVARRYRSQHKQRLRVATKYARLARAFLEAHDVFDYRLVESAGATEAAPSSGAADLIVDISSTGATLAANHLKTLVDGRILRSEASLFIAPAALTRWSEASLGALEKLLTLMDARLSGGKHKDMRATLALPAKATSEAAIAEKLTQLVEALERLGVQRVEVIGAGSRHAQDGQRQVFTIQTILDDDQVYEAVTIVKSFGAVQCLVSSAELLFEAESSTYKKALDRLKLGAP